MITPQEKLEELFQDFNLFPLHVKQQVLKEVETSIASWFTHLLMEQCFSASDGVAVLEKLSKVAVNEAANEILIGDEDG